MIVAVAEHPCFADRTIVRKRRGEQARQATSAPEAILVNRIEPQRVQRYLIHALFSNACPRKVPVIFSPSRRSIGRRGQPGCNRRGDTRPAAPPIRCYPAPSKSPRRVAG